MTAPFIAPAFPPDNGTVVWSAASLAAYADAFEDFLLDADWQREAWEAQQAINQSAYWARRDRENSDA